MEMLNTILGISASILSILSILWARSNSQNINKIKGTIEAGDNSINTIGQDNRINK